MTTLDANPLSLQNTNTTFLPESIQTFIGLDHYMAAHGVFDVLRVAFSIISLPLNIVNIVVFTQRSMRTPTSTYRIAMSVSQIIYVAGEINYPAAQLAGTWSESTLLGLFVSLILNPYLLLSVTRVMYGLVFLLSIERLMAIAFPLKSKLFRFTRTPSLSVVVLYGLVFFSHLHIPCKFEFYEDAVSSIVNDTSNSCCSENFRKVSKSDTTFPVVFDFLSGTTFQGNGNVPSEEEFFGTIFGDSSSVDAMTPPVAHGVVITEILHASSASLPQTSSPSYPSPFLSHCACAPSAPATVWKFRVSSLYLRLNSFFVTWAVVVSVVWVYVVLLLDLLINVLLIISLVRQTQRGCVLVASETAAKRDRQVRQTTLTVLVSSLLFVFFSLPLVTNVLVSYLHSSYGYFSQYRYIYMLLLELGTTSFSLSLCIDGLAFTLLSSEYRKTLLSLAGRMCAGCRRRKDSPKTDRQGKSTCKENEPRTEVQTLSYSTQKQSF